MKKISVTGIEARNRAVAGMSYVATAIKSTIGPFGLNFLLEKENKVTNDGYTISSELCPTLDNEFERRGALTAHRASAKTNDMVGDATSTSWALTESIVKEAVRYLPKEGSIKSKKTASEIISMIAKSKENVIERLKEKTKSVDTKEELIQSALVSVENENIAELLGSMQWELGPEGIIVAEEVNEVESSIEKVKGIRIDNGFGASHLINNPEKQSLEVSDIPVLLTNYTIDVTELNKLKDPVFNHLINKKQFGVVIIARAFTSEAIKLCQSSTMNGFEMFPINAPYVYQTQVMKDIEAVTGGRYVDIEESSFDDIYISDVGYIKRLVARQFDAIITGEDTPESEERITERINQLRLSLIGEQSDFGKKLIEARIAQLSHGFGILKVGSQSLTDRKRLKDKCDDAVNAVRLALKGGTIRGGGIALKEISDEMPEDDILKRPLLCIYDQITSSAPDGWEIPEWVRDPYLVITCALDNACAEAGTFSSINGIVTSKDVKEKDGE